MHVMYGKCTVSQLGHASVRIATPKDRFIYIDLWAETIDNPPRDVISFSLGMMITFTSIRTVLRQSQDLTPR